MHACMVSETTKRNNKLNRELRKLHGGKCEVRGCNRTRNLEWSHVRPTKLKGAGRGRAKRLYDVKNNPKAYQLRCRKHNPRGKKPRQK